MTYLPSLRLVATLQCHARTPSYKVSFKSNFKVVGLSHNICATIVPLYLLFGWVAIVGEICPDSDECLSHPVVQSHDVCPDSDEYLSHPIVCPVPSGT